MILIISSNKSRFTSPTSVIKWLVFLEKPFIKFDESSQVYVESYSSTSGIKLIDESTGKSISEKGITGFWIRDTTIEHLPFLPIPDLNGLPQKMEAEINLIYSRELKVLWEGVLNRLETKLNGMRFRHLNKLTTIRKAEQLTFKIAPSFISQDQKLINSRLEQQAYITKPVTNVYSYSDASLHISSSTISPTKEVPIRKSKIFPSFLEKKIKGKYELRVIYIKGKMFTFAVISSNKDADDIRKTQQSNPNRFVPFIIDESMKKKVRALMQEMQLNFGIVDFIVDQDDQYYFLEVNGSGDINYISRICNFNLAKEIALAL